MTTKSYKPRINLIGRSFNHLTIVKLDQNRSDKNRRAFWFCTCACGRPVPKSKRGDHIQSGFVMSCGCLHPKYKLGNQNPCFKGYKEIHGVFWQRIIDSAKKRNIEFDITIEYIWNLFIKQNRKCALSGLSLCFTKTTIELMHGGATASLDRKDSSKGYVKDNVQWVHKKVNKIKQDLQEKELVELCKTIAKYNP